MSCHKSYKYAHANSDLIQEKQMVFHLIEGITSMNYVSKVFINQVQPYEAMSHLYHTINKDAIDASIRKYGWQGHHKFSDPA